MSINYKAGDFLIRIKNAILAGKKELEVPATRYVSEIAGAMKREKLLESVTEKDGKLNIKVAYKNKKPVILNIKVVSRPGLRIYKTIEELEKRKGASILILSTNKGVISSKEALKQRIGGEVIAEIY